jgi:uncharacterized membrane protein YgdD (TMEM256/DUF423 family)
MNLVSIGALVLSAGIALGAFGAHAFKSQLIGDAAGWYATAVDYHMWHGLGLMAIGLGGKSAPRPTWVRRGSWLMGFGLFVFCGCLYTMALSGYRGLGAIVPIGGTSLLFSWVCIAWGFLGNKPRSM